MCIHFTRMVKSLCLSVCFFAPYTRESSVVVVAVVVVVVVIVVVVSSLTLLSHFTI